MPAKRTLAPDEYELIRSLVATGASHWTVARTLGVSAPRRFPQGIARAPKHLRNGALTHA